MINCLWHTNHDSKSVPKRCLSLFIDLCFMNFIACNNRACNNWCGWFQEHSPLQVPPGMESPVASPSDAPGVWYYDRVRWQKARTFPVCFLYVFVVGIGKWMMLMMFMQFQWWINKASVWASRLTMWQSHTTSKQSFQPRSVRYWRLWARYIVEHHDLNWLSSKCTMK